MCCPALSFGRQGTSSGGPGGLLAAIAARARLGRFDYETLITGFADLIPLQRLSIAKIDWAHTIVPVIQNKAL
jgi:hypothetical protein